MLKLVKEDKISFYFPAKHVSTLYKGYSSVNPHILRGVFFTLDYVSPLARVFEIVRFEGKKFLFAEKLLELFVKNGFTPAFFDQLLAVGHTKHQLPQGSGTLISLGDAWFHPGQGPAAPCINRVEKRKDGKLLSTERHLGLHYHADLFEPHEHFLVVKK